MSVPRPVVQAMLFVSRWWCGVGASLSRRPIPRLRSICCNLWSGTLSQFFGVADVTRLASVCLRARFAHTSVFQVLISEHGWLCGRARCIRVILKSGWESHSVFFVPQHSRRVACAWVVTWHKNSRRGESRREGVHMRGIIAYCLPRRPPAI